MVIFKSSVKSEANLENRINGLELKTESEPETNTIYEYPTSLEDFFQRAGGQMFMLQVISHCKSFSSDNTV